jgi:hypothetical protein
MNFLVNNGRSGACGIFSCKVMKVSKIPDIKNPDIAYSPNSLNLILTEILGFLLGKKSQRNSTTKTKKFWW